MGGDNISLFRRIAQSSIASSSYRQDHVGMVRSINDEFQYNGFNNLAEERYYKETSGERAQYVDVNTLESGEQISRKEAQSKMDHEQLLLDHIKDLTVSVRKENKEREDRIDKKFDSLEDRIDKKFDSLEDRIDKKIGSLEDRIDKKVDSVMADLREREVRIDAQMTSVITEARGTKRWIIGLCFSTIIGIAAIAITVMAK